VFDSTNQVLNVYPAVRRLTANAQLGFGFDRTVRTTLGERVVILIPATLRPGRIDEDDRSVADVAVEVEVPSLKSDRVLAQPPSDGRVVPAVEVVLEARVAVERPGGEEEQRIHRRGGCKESFGRIGRPRHPAGNCTD